LVRSVLDANVYVSALIQPDGTPGQIIERFLRDKTFEVVVSPAVVDEVLRVLAYPKVRRLTRAAPEVWFEDIVVLADMVVGELRVSGVCDDPDDDKYIAAALEGRADYIVTGDKRFLELREYEGLQIVNPRPFLDLLGA